MTEHLGSTVTKTFRDLKGPPFYRAAWQAARKRLCSSQLRAGPHIPQQARWLAGGDNPVIKTEHLSAIPLLGTLLNSVEACHGPIGFLLAQCKIEDRDGGHRVLTGMGAQPTIACLAVPRSAHGSGYERDRARGGVGSPVLHNDTCSPHSKAHLIGLNGHKSCTSVLIGRKRES